MFRQAASIGVLVTGVLVCVACLTGCSRTDPGVDGAPQASAGQVRALVVDRATFYAASRLADQASFGPTPELVDEIRRKGIEGWIDEQLALPPSLAEIGITADYSRPSAERWYYSRGEVMRLFLSAPDQLRTRVTWALSQFIVVTPVEWLATMSWFNLLQGHALGNYRDLLQAASIHPAMAVFLNNDQNRPRSAECPNCQPNENFARELMQLFTLGVVKLGADGTPLRNASGRLIPTYSQTDVEELARVLTGWQFDPVPAGRDVFNWANWTKPMIPSTWPPERDSGAKTVLGRVFPAGQTAPRDLADAVDLLMSHDNIAPFVSLRLIQHLVKSDPSPDYVRRVAAVFVNNGRNFRGDLKAVVKAILLDSEARRGDVPVRAAADDGKLREPLLYRTAVYRGLGCTSIPMIGAQRNLPVDPATQRPFHAETVFGFYAPSDRSTVTGRSAPEQRLLNTEEISQRLEEFRLIIDYPSLQPTTYRNANCSRLPALYEAYRTTPSAWPDMVSRLYFRGAMSPAVRRELVDMLPKPSDQATYKDFFHVLGNVLALSDFGAIQ